MNVSSEHNPENRRLSILSPKLWIYTNFDCNLSCGYCVAESSPVAPRRALGLEDIQRISDEALEIGFEQIFLTGGEPFLLKDIYHILAYTSERMPTTVLTNAMLFDSKQLEQLQGIANANLNIQVSLDGGSPAAHDPFRGPGTWRKTVEGIKLLQSNGFQVSIRTTVTPANADVLDDLHAFRRGLGIADKEHFVLPMARRGFAEYGVDVDTDSLLPEMTISAYGTYWYPLVSPGDSDMKVSDKKFPLYEAVQSIEERLRAA
jgi:MoaA/NifB/PqqE/SkfB family radical SAM enzyme